MFEFASSWDCNDKKQVHGLVIVVYKKKYKQMAKIVLDSEPSSYLNPCPFTNDSHQCLLNGLHYCECMCGYDGYFDFSRCQFCTTIKDKGNERT